MGTWGAGNLESDMAADYLMGEIFAPLIQQILSVLETNTSAEADEDADATVIAMDALAALCSHFHETSRIKKTQLEAVQARFMAVWSPSMDGLDPVPGHKAARQAQIEATFARLLAHCQDDH